MRNLLSVIFIVSSGICFSQEQFDPVKSGYVLIWQDEFDQNGKVDSTKWSFEKGLVRNQELQWYQEQNAIVRKGNLIITGKRETVPNPNFASDNLDWRKSRKQADYTSSSINTRGKFDFQYGIVEVRAKIDTALGMWPAIWTLGIKNPWPANGEIDIMEYYRVKDVPTILANAAWADEGQYKAKWDEAKIPFENFLKKDPAWPSKFHLWRMEWSEKTIRLYLDNELLNEIDLAETLNPDGINPFRHPHYLLLNLAIGGNGGDPSGSFFPSEYLVDYVRVYQRKN
ncbi:family 16 glycosylhydrolase [Algoriphagus sp. A40]|uniref:glycoside hydrolase family 16 protein n=1 Tax=Algoriphagus sp. A40 TaxID=1945863 RepID=UPI000985841E|nr:glycoside hydrolase family 16 protein [Algoriphagus sp. A40]OOG76911.1 beta-glucanase [Algoriphagus sp. A40]